MAYGGDVERIVNGLGGLHSELSKQLKALAKQADYRIETIEHSHNATVQHVADGGHSHPGDSYQIHQHGAHQVAASGGATGATGSNGNIGKQLTYAGEYSADSHPDHPHTESSVIYERAHPAPAAGFISSIETKYSAVKGETGKMSSIKGAMKTPDGNKHHNSIGSPFQEMEELDEAFNDVKEYAGAHAQLQWIGEKHALLALMNSLASAVVNAKYAVIHYQDYLQRGYDEVHNGGKQSVQFDDFIHGKTVGNVVQ
jgi:hypothetical protein